jgi:hypothetical protein
VEHTNTQGQEGVGGVVKEKSHPFFLKEEEEKSLGDNNPTSIIFQPQLYHPPSFT